MFPINVVGAVRVMAGVGKLPISPMTTASSEVVMAAPANIANEPAAPRSIGVSAATIAKKTARSVGYNQTIMFQSGAASGRKDGGGRVRGEEGGACQN
jgi:hypothetical protein